MTASSDAYWDELGIAWCAIEPKVEIVMPRLKARLRRQTVLINACLIFGLPLAILGILLGAYTIAVGWRTGAWFFVTRGTAIEIGSGLLLYAWSLLRPVGADRAAAALPAMIDLAIARAQRTLGAIRLGFYSCAVAALFGLVGVAIRTYQGRPPQLSPIIPLALIAIIAMGLFLYGRETRTALAKYRHLRHALGIDAIGG